MALEEFSKTAIQISGWSWTVFDHILSLGYITLFVWLVSKWLKFKNKDLRIAIYISLICTIISFLSEIFLPIKLALLVLVTIFFIFAILINQFYKEKWKKSLLGALILIGLILVVNIILGIIHAIFLLAK